MDSVQAVQRRAAAAGMVTMSPSQTPRSSDKSARDLRSAATDSNLHEKEKGVNVQVLLRFRPLSEDEIIVEGYNCTIFAYGQTGTGKTYTMEGGARKKNGEFPSDAGVMQRAAIFFDILEAQAAEYSMKITFLELYNEEITDLLALEETTKFTDDKSKKPIALMEDGKCGVFVRGLEEEIVCTASSKTHFRRSAAILLSL